jgi:carboxymethylenebutenolidase
MPDTTYSPTPERTLGGYVARPRGNGPFPGVVVIMDAFGLSNDIRQQADRLATAGYLAFAPDLYSGRGLKCVIGTLKASRSGQGEAYENIEGARRWLADDADCTGEIGIIGFCMGGGFAVMSAPRYDFRAAAVNYGELPDDPATSLKGACPIVASYGRRDRGLPGRAGKLEAALTTLGVEHDVKEYADSGHSFMNRFNVGPTLSPVLKFTGMHYVHDDAEDSWRRILDFFDAHLRGKDD